MRFWVKNCTGCSACSSVCPKQAIVMKPDKEGFYKPNLDKDKCVNCGLCRKVCPVYEDHSEKLLHQPSLSAFAVKSRSKELQLLCTSGGFFTTLAEAWLVEGGIVYGAAYDENFAVRHIRIGSIGEVRRLSGSKYVQSMIGNSFSLAKEDLIAGRKVLFSGTACQIAGIRSFLGKEYDNLLCIDLICHGVPSPQIWNWYVGKLQQQQGRAVCVTHRGKCEGGWSWQKQFFEMRLENGQVFQENIWENVYMRGFLKDFYLNRSCYKCQFKNAGIRRVSDLTIADYWGCENEEKEFFDPNGVNLVIVNSSRGQQILKQSQPLFHMKETALKAALRYNMAAVRSYRKPYARAYFYKRIHAASSLEAFGALISKCERVYDIETRIHHDLSRIRAKCRRMVRGK